MSDEKRRDDPFPPIEPSAIPPFDPYNPGPLPGKPLTTEQLNRASDFAVCQGKHGWKRGGGHSFENGVACSKCGMLLKEFKRAGGIVF